MKKLLQVSGAIALLAIASFFASLSVLTVESRAVVKQAGSDEAALAKSANGTLVELHKLIYTSNVSAAEVGRAALAERFYAEKQLPATLAKANQVLDNTNAALVNTNTLLSSLKADGDTITASAALTLKQTTDTIASVKPVADNAAAATASLNTLISSPATTDTIAHVDKTAAHIDATTADVQSYVHGITHPSWATRIFHWTLDVVHAINPF